MKKFIILVCMAWAGFGSPARAVKETYQIGGDSLFRNAGWNEGTLNTGVSPAELTLSFTPQDASMSNVVITVKAVELYDNLVVTSTWLGSSGGSHAERLDDNDAFLLTVTYADPDGVLTSLSVMEFGPHYNDGAGETTVFTVGTDSYSMLDTENYLMNGYHATGLEELSLANADTWSMLVTVDDTLGNTESAMGGLVLEYSSSTYTYTWNLSNHPSIISTQAQLDATRNAVITGSDARAGWDDMLAQPWSSLSYAHSAQATVFVTPSGSNPSETAWRYDGQAARSHALQWVLTGDTAHRDKALAILNDWGSTFQNMELEGGGYGAQIQLECAWSLPVWAGAADIMRYYNNGAANWSAADIAAFDNYLFYMYAEAYKTRWRWSTADYASIGNGYHNWAVSANWAMMAYGAWSDQVDMFEEGYDNLQFILGDFSLATGEINETGRDTTHPQYSIVSLTDAAEMAHNMGYDELYTATFDGQATPRLAVILEYFANLMLGNTSYPGQDYTGAYSTFDNYEVPYQHYINDLGVGYLPNFQNMVENYWRSNVGDDAHFLLWSRVTHGEAGTPLPFPFSDGFDDGFGNWLENGVSLSNTRYEGTRSCRMNDADYIFTEVNTTDHSDILISYARNTSGLSAGDSFVSEWYDGSSWHTIENITSGFSGWTLVSQIALPAGAAYNPHVMIRFRVDTASASAYVDAVVIEGTYNPAQPPLITDISMNPDYTVSLDLLGTAGINYRVQATTNLSETAWVEVSTNTASTNGTWHVTDFSATNMPNRFYRIITP